MRKSIKLQNKKPEIIVINQDRKKRLQSNYPTNTEVHIFTGNR